MFFQPAMASEALMQSEQYWGVRDLDNSSRKAIEMLEKELKNNKNNYALYWHLSRFHYWSASEAQTDNAKAHHAKKGWQYADKAKRLNPKSIEGWYWATANIGLYGETLNTFQAIKQGLADNYLENANKAIEIDPNYDDGGPYRSLGRYYTKLPWPMQDLDKSKRLIERSLKKNNQRSLSLYFYADAQLESGDTVGAQKSFMKILSLIPENGNSPEIRKYQKLAREKLKSF